MKNPIIIASDSIECFLKEYGIFTQRIENYLEIIDIYPALTPDIKERKITLVNNKNPFKRQNWVIGKNKIQFINGDEYIIILNSFSWDKIYYHKILTEKTLIIQIIDFDEDISKYKNLIEERIYLVVDIRINFGGEVNKIDRYFSVLKDLIYKDSIKKCFILISNSTCSSAEILVEKLNSLNKVFVIGNETYNKKFVYKKLEINGKEIFIPYYSLNVNINRYQDVNFYKYFDLYSLDHKRYYSKPDLWSI